MTTYMSAKPIKEELDDYFDYSVYTASSNAFVLAIFYNVNYLVVCFKINGSEEYESIITNLPREFVYS